MTSIPLRVPKNNDEEWICRTGEGYWTLKNNCEIHSPSYIPTKVGYLLEGNCELVSIAEDCPDRNIKMYNPAWDPVFKRYHWPTACCCFTVERDCRRELFTRIVSGTFN